jgi:hypothetical protein
MQLQSSRNYWGVAGLTGASLLLWLLPIFSRMTPKQQFLFNSLALGASVQAAIESKRLERLVKADAIEELIGSDVGVSYVKLEADRRKEILQQRYGTLPVVQPVIEPAIEPEWEPTNPFEHGGAFPVEDLAETLAKATNSGTLIIAPSGCGKTRLMQHAISKAHAHYDCNVDFQVIDCKGEEDGWLGLENSPNDYQLLDDDMAKAGFSQLMVMKGALTRVDIKVPMIGIIDEWNNGISSLKNSTEVNRDEVKAAISAGRQIVTKGRSKRLYGWMTTHTPETDAIGMDSATRQSFNIVILARGNKLGLISSILKNVYKFVDDDTTREKLLLAYQHFMQTGSSELKEKPVALTNLNGDWRLVRLPDYRDAPESIDWGVLNGGDADEPTPKPQPQAGAKEPATATNSRFSPEYQQYLDSAEWQQRRERIKPKRCSGCGATVRLELNHVRYPKRGSSLQAFIDQPDEDFAWLCHDCHVAVTKSNRRRRQNDTQ